MEKQIYISEEERGKFKKVANAFTELYEMDNILVVDAGRNGYNKLIELLMGNNEYCNLINREGEFSAFYV